MSRASTKETGTCSVAVLGISIHFGLMHQTLELREVLHFFKVVRGWMLDNERGIYNESENCFSKRSIEILELRTVTNWSGSILIRVFIFKKKSSSYLQFNRVVKLGFSCLSPHKHTRSIKTCTPYIAQSD